jgi:glycosyltransferase involved in cell wall biosynthesis
MLFAPSAITLWEPPMICVAVTRIKNEADIIEAFVRHHARYFDAIVVSDDGSTDSSFDILQKLKAQGMPLTLLRQPSVGFEQSRFMTLLIRRAFTEPGADWVGPLDAMNSSRCRDRQALPMFSLTNFVPSGDCLEQVCLVQD